MNSPQTMTGGQAVIAQLLAEGVDTIFGIPGGHNLPLYDALRQHAGQLRHVSARHEQGLAFMADGYSRSSGKVGVLTATSGPAVANLASPLGQASTDTSSVLAICSTVRSDLVGRNRGGLHDYGESLEIMRAVCRKAVRCDRVEEIPATIRELLDYLASGRPGAVYCEIPADILAAKGAVATVAPTPARRPTPDAQLVRDAASRLAQAQRPLLWVGTGATLSDAQAEVRELAARLGAVVVHTTLGRGLIPADHPQVAAIDGALSTEVNELIAAADVVLAIGTMFKQEDTANWSARMGDSLIHIDIDPTEMGRSYSPAVGLVGDARQTLRALLGEMPPSSPTPASWWGRAKQAEAARLANRRTKSPLEMQAVDVMHRVVPHDAVLICDRCNLGYWVYRCGWAWQPRSFQYPMGYGGLGGALPQAIGTKLAHPNKNVICVIGDGGFQFTGPELATAVQERTPITIVLCNNGGYGALRAGQDRNFGGQRFGVDLWNPDFQTIARAYGIPACRCDTLESFATELDSAIQANDLRLIELTVDLADP